MSVINFSPSFDVAAHPQAKLLGWDLLFNRLNNRLNDTEISVLEKGLDEQSLAGISSLSQREQYRLLLCAVVSKNKSISIQELFQIAKETLKLPSKLLAELFIFTADTALITSIFAEMSDEEIWDFATGSGRLFLKELVCRDLLSTLTFLLNYPLNNGDDIKNLFITDNNFYSLACESGHLDIIQHLESIAGFDRKAAAEVGDYAAYRAACSCGHIDIIQHLESIEGFDKKAAAEADDYAAYQAACQNGHLDIIQHLEAIEDFDREAAAEEDNYVAYQAACQNGHLDIIQHLETIEDFDRKAAAEASIYYNYPAYRAACSGGHLDIIQHLEAIEDFDREAAAKANDYAAYQVACHNGHLDIIQHLESIAGFDRKAAAEADNYGAYRAACQNGHIEIIQHLESIAGFDRKAAAEAGNYAAYQAACQNGHIEIIQHLEGIAGFDRKAAAEADDYMAYRFTCENGHIDIIQHLEGIEGFDRKVAAKTWDYGAYRFACLNGHIEIIQHLESIAGFDRKAAAEADNYGAYRAACQNGHIEIIQHLEAIESFDRKAAAEADDYMAYRFTCENGQLDIIKHLERIEGFDKKAAVEADYYGAYRSACESGHLNMIQHLQQIPSCFSYAEKHDFEYGENYIYPFVTSKLTKLAQDKSLFETSTPNGVFDVDSDTAQFYFVVLRNLIRRGVRREHSDEIREAENLLDEIRLLLSIPSVRNLCHQRVDIRIGSPGSENELLKQAQQIGNEEAATILLALPDVYRLAEQNDFYQNEVQNGPDLRQLAQDEESSMVALSQGEQATVDKVKRHYQEAIKNKGGTQAVFDEFIQLLKSQYEENPAKISVPGDAIIELPMDWDELQELRKALTDKEYQRALKAYFQHDVHTVLRYLSKPNQWMHPKADYVYSLYDKQRRIIGRYSTFEDYKALITLFYTASHDEHTPAIDGYNSDSRKALFIKELALIGRTHNWDKTRFVLDKDGNRTFKDGKAVLEEYDDLELDRPSCYSGVNRRLFQSVLGHGLFKTVTPSIIKQAVNEQLIKYFDTKITKENAQGLMDAYNGIIEAKDMDRNIETLKALNIPQDVKDNIVANVTLQLSEAYKENFDAYKSSFQQQMAQYLNTGSRYQPDIMAFNESLSLVRLIDERCAEHSQLNGQRSSSSVGNHANTFFATGDEEHSNLTSDERTGYTPP